jgi:uncharacterized protein (DUF1800 family)
VTALARQIETLRGQALGDFAGLLNAIAADPAMLVWLDGGKSLRERPNENFAREFLELFTLGQGAYSERDVREAARAFTGWVYEPVPRSPSDYNPSFYFDDDVHDTGHKTFRGQTGNWKSDDIVRITLAQPQAAQHLARTLYRSFVAEDPEPADALIEPLAEVLRSNGFSIRRTLDVILRSRHFYSNAAYRHRIKSPVEFTVGMLRVLEVPRQSVNLMAAAAACAKQGQELFAPPGVNGWDGGTVWLNSSTYLERVNWATDLIWGHPDRGVRAFDPVGWLDRYRVPRGEAAAAFLSLLLQDDVAAETKTLVLAAGRDQGVTGVRKALERMLHSPEYQLA